jgi:SDR family mycofactocin-dependent oxidoreductase
MGRVDGKVAFVTGAARGQGRSHAVKLASEGADIIAVDICEDIASNNYPLSRMSDLEETAGMIEKLDRRVVFRKADVRDRDQLQSAVDEGVAELGHLEVVCANAGICPLGGDVPPIGFLDVMQVNFNGVVNAVAAALPHLQRGASIICTGSLASFMTGTTDNPAQGPGGAGYSFAKRTVAMLAHDMALALAPFGIRVNAVHPTNCNTDMLQSAPMYGIFRPDLENPTKEDCLEAMTAMTVMGNSWVEPEDISNGVLYLASDESRFVTGVQLKIDAGGYVRNVPFSL